MFTRETGKTTDLARQHDFVLVDPIGGMFGLGSVAAAANEVEFFQQARPVQERFVNSTLGTGVPRPILHIPYHNRQPLGWRIASGAAFVSALLLTSVGFGRLESSIGIAPVHMIAVYGVCLALAVGCWLYAGGIVERATSLPYRPGLYLFPCGLIDARAPRFQVTPLEELQGTRFVPSGNRLELTFTGGRTFTFPVGEKATAEAVEHAISDAQAQLRRAAASSDWRTVAALDPLRDNGFSNPFSANEPLPQAVPLFSRPFAVVPVALVLGLTLGGGLWFARNWRSEQHLFAKARQADTVEAYEQYLSRGGKQPDVEELLLPRAKLRSAQAAGTVAAIEGFAKTHGGGKIASEIADALKAQLLKELNLAAAPGTLEALRKFKQDFPSHEPVKQELQRYIDGVRDVAILRFKRDANSDEGAPKFFEALIRYAIEHEPKVMVRFLRLPSDSLEPTDRAIKRSTYYGGNFMIPSQYFADDYMLKRETRAGKEIVERLQKAFPADIIRFELGPLVPGETPPSPEVPTLFIHQRVQLSGAFLSKKPRGAWAGAGVLFKATFQIPGSAEAFEVKHSTWRPPNPLVLLKPEATAADLYEEMATTAYGRFVRKFLGSVFSDP